MSYLQSELAKQMKVQGCANQGYEGALGVPSSPQGLAGLAPKTGSVGNELNYQRELVDQLEKATADLQAKIDPFLIPGIENRAETEPCPERQLYCPLGAQLMSITKRMIQLLHQIDNLRVRVDL